VSDMVESEVEEEVKVGGRGEGEEETEVAVDGGAKEEEGKETKEEGEEEEESEEGATEAAAVPPNSNDRATPCTAPDMAEMACPKEEPDGGAAVVAGWTGETAETGLLRME
jgi:hypothetical protein